MILDWCSRDMPYSAQDRIAAVLLECGGAIEREHLLLLLAHCVQRSRIDEVLRDMRKRRYVDTIFLAGHRVIYLLSTDGMAYAKQVVGITSRVRSVQGRVSHCIAANKVLMRCVSAFGFDGWAWHSSSEAVDHLVHMRQRKGFSLTEIRRTLPLPSALVRTPDNQKAWLQIDLNASSRMVFEACKNYVASLDTLSESMRRVLFVGWIPERTKWLESAVKGDDRVSIKACSLDHVVEILEGSKVPTH